MIHVVLPAAGGILVALATTMTAALPGETSEPTLAEEEAFRRAGEQVAAAVVRIEPLALSAEASGPREAAAGRGPSTGLIVAADRIIATEFAVPADVDAAVVVLPDGKRRAARVRGRDRVRKLVLLATDDLPAAPPLEAVPRGRLRPGQWAIAVGRGWDATSPNIAVGIVSAVDRAWGLGVQTDAAISPMNYGGPLVDIAGQVIGVLVPLSADTAGLTDGTELYDAGIGFAVPLEDIRAILPRLEAGESLSAGILGISYRDRDAINGEPVIASVRQGSPAAAAGLEPGDRLIRIGDRQVTRIADARHAITPRHAGDTLAIAVRRGEDEAAKLIETTATLAAELPPWRRAVVGLIPAAAKPADDDAAPSGIPIGWVLPGGPAAQAGIAAGDRLDAIATAEGEPASPVGSAEEAAGLLAGLEPGQPAWLTVSRDGVASTVPVVTIPLPADVPAEGPPAEPVAVDPLAGPQDGVDVVRLEAAEVAEPPLAVIPRGEIPLGVLVWCGPPHGPVAEAEAVAWRAAAARHAVAVILVGSGDPDAWSRDDITGVARALATLNRRRPIDPDRVAISGKGAGAAFAWLAAERLGRGIGVALVDAPLPRRAAIEPATPAAARWILLGPGRDEPTRQRVAADQARLERAGHTAGLLPLAAAAGEAVAGQPPADLLCRWVSLLGLL